MKARYNLCQRPSHAGWCPVLLALAVVWTVVGCKKKQDPIPNKENADVVLAPSVVPSGSASSQEIAKARIVPYMAPEPVKLADGSALHGELYAVEGALLVAEAQRVGRLIDGNRVEWLGKIPPTSPGLGQNKIIKVVGRWPELIETIYTTTNGRAPAPNYYPLIGKGDHQVIIKEWGASWIVGPGHVGKTTVTSHLGAFGEGHLTSVRGPQLRFQHQSAVQFGCHPDEMKRKIGSDLVQAVLVSALEGTDSGWLVSIGALCQKRGAAAEIWHKGIKSKIVELKQWFPNGVFPSAQVIRGGDNLLWLYNGASGQVLRFENGEFTPIPKLETFIRKIFVSQKGVLHAFDGQRVFRFEKQHWNPVVRLTWPISVNRLAFENGTFWVSAGGIKRLVPAPSVEMNEQCKTPFVYLYKVSSLNNRKFTFPTTRKALSSFPQVDQLKLVEFNQFSEWQLGLIVSDKAQAEAVVAHLKTTMKEEKPKVLCFAPEHPRIIEIVKKP
jgi:hypothetical protein